jgi:hypothetical protein
VHFGRGVHDLANACIEVVSEAVFCDGRPIAVLQSPATFAADEIVARALSRVGEKGYALFDNNCEHFVNWCRSDKPFSEQSTLFETVIRQTAAIGSRGAVRKVVATNATRAVAGRLPILLARGTAIAALAADAAQTATEFAATSLGKDQRESKRAGRSVGAASSAGIGFAIGGPAGAAASFAFWATGQAIGARFFEHSKQAIEQSLARRSSEDA